MEKLRKFNLEDDYLEIKESLEYPTLSLTDDNDKVWVKEKPISYIIAKYYISEDDVNGGSEFGTQLFGTTYQDIHHIISHYIVDDGTRVEYNDYNSSINEYHQFTTIGEHTVTLYIKEDINDMFSLGDSFKYTSLSSIDFSHFLESSHVTDMNAMFHFCINLTSVTFGDNFDTSNVTSMGNMFYNCDNLTSLDLSNFDTSNVTHMHNMFFGSNNLTSLDLNGWDISKVERGDCAFYGVNNDAVIGIDPTLNIFNCIPPV